VGNKKELFATAICKDIPLAAIVVDGTLQSVRLTGEPKEGQFFCRFEYSILNIFD
jgi:hypothetical protein